MERFLYRSSKTPYTDDFILKGGLMFYSLGLPMRRPTRDIDFLGGIAQEDISLVICSVLSMSVPDDGVIFDVDSLKLFKMHIDADHNGIRVTFMGYLGNAKIPMQIDIGFSDELAATTLSIDYPVLCYGRSRIGLLYLLLLAGRKDSHINSAGYCNADQAYYAQVNRRAAVQASGSRPAR